MGKPRKALQSFAAIFPSKEHCCINNSSADFCIIGKGERSVFDKA